jgi:hypothetical protein
MDQLENDLCFVGGTHGAAKFRDQTHKQEFEFSCQMIFPRIEADKIWKEQLKFASGHHPIEMTQIQAGLTLSWQNASSVYSIPPKKGKNTTQLSEIT